MKCPECFSVNNSKVLDSRPCYKTNLTYIRRRRECLSCEFRFSTYEILAEDLSFLRGTIRKLRSNIESIIDLTNLMEELKQRFPRSDPME